jgi:hypothetical protein
LRESSNVIASEAREVGHRDRGGNTVNVQLSGDEVMKNLRFVLVALLAFVVTSAGTIPSSAHHAISQSQGSTALERGYRTGYSDGYNAGFKDVADHAARDYQSKEDYQRADRAYVEAWGPVEDYRDGYQQGFETGYAAGYDKRPFESALPSGFKRRGAVESRTSSGNTGGASSNNNPTVPADSTQSVPVTHSTSMNGAVSIPKDATLLVELQNSLSTDATQRGDRFLARVVEPREFEGAMIEGRVTRVQRPGRIKGTAELQLSFDEIRLPDNRRANLHAEVVEVLPTGGSSGVSDVDSEGGVKGKDSTKDNVTKIGAATGVGAIIGAIVGGGKGAAIGAAIGAGVGTGGVLSSPGKDIRLARGQQLRIRTSTDANIQSNNQ